MDVKFFRRNFHFSAYYKLSKLTFSKKNEYFFSEKVHSDRRCVPLFSGLRHTELYLCYSASGFFRANFQQAFLAF